MTATTQKEKTMTKSQAKAAVLAFLLGTDSYTAGPKELMGGTGLSAAQIKPIIEEMIDEATIWAEDTDDGLQVGLTKTGAAQAQAQAEPAEEEAEEPAEEALFDDEEEAAPAKAAPAKAAGKAKKESTPAQKAAREAFAQKARERGGKGGAAATKATPPTKTAGAAPAARATKAAPAAATKAGNGWRAPFTMQYDTINTLDAEALTDRRDACFKYAAAMFKGTPENYEADIVAETLVRMGYKYNSQLEKLAE
jgi:outer membrane biosynthesis protein TonB